MAAIKSGTVRVVGLDDLRKALRSLDKDAGKELAAEAKQVAQMVADHARSRALSIGGVAAKTAPSITARGGQRSAGVSFGGARYPFGGGAEFGSMRYPQFEPWTGNGPDAGYFVYPSIRDDAGEIEDMFTDRMNKLIARRFPQ